MFRKTEEYLFILLSKFKVLYTFLTGFSILAYNFMKIRIRKVYDSLVGENVMYSREDITGIDLHSEFLFVGRVGDLPSYFSCQTGFKNSDDH